MLYQEWVVTRNTKIHLTFNVEFSCGDCGAGHESVLGAVSKVNVSDAQSVIELFAAGLTSVRGPDLCTVLQPFECDFLIVDIHLKRDYFFLLSIHVL